MDSRAEQPPQPLQAGVRLRQPGIENNPIYAAVAAGTAKNAYNLALSDWFKPPVIHQITQEVGSILMHATDNVQVTEVRVTISDEQGNMLEQGKAVPLEKGAWWEYASTTGGRVHVEAFDPAGNMAGLDL